MINSPAVSQSPAATDTARRARCIAVTSGKGGVGKSNVSTNLAVALARTGRRVCIFDADTSLANVNILLNITPGLTLEHLLDGSATIDDIIIAGPGNISLVPAASGIAEFTRLDLARQKILLDALLVLERRFDYLLIDTAAGIGSNVTMFLEAAPHCLVVVTPEPTSLTDAFSLLKVLRRQNIQTTVHILTNMVDSYPQSVDLFKRISGASTKYLQLQLHYFGYIPRDDALRLAVQQQRPVLLSYPGAAISARFESLAASMDQLLTSQQPPGAFSVFLQKLFLRGLLEKRAATHTAGETGEAVRPPSTRRYSKALVLRLQQGMAQLIKSRSLPSASMRSLISSLLQLIERHYPDIDLTDLNKPQNAQKSRSGIPMNHEHGASENRNISE
jgi:MinD-like ATPase involved in chromosome partitioning or flagellar assembly